MIQFIHIGNTIGRKGARMISDSLRSNTTLTELNLEDLIMMIFNRIMRNDEMFEQIITLLMDQEYLVKHYRPIQH